MRLHCKKKIIYSFGLNSNIFIPAFQLHDVLFVEQRIKVTKLCFVLMIYFLGFVLLF